MRNEAAAVGLTPCSAIARTSSWTKNGTPPVTSWQAPAKAGSTSVPNAQPHQLGHRPLAQRREFEDLGRRAGGERRKHRRGISRPAGPRRGDDRDRQLIESPPEELQETQRGLVGPVDIV